jgi:hypothetical protein
VSSCPINRLPITGKYNYHLIFPALQIWIVVGKFLTPSLVVCGRLYLPLHFILKYVSEKRGLKEVKNRTLRRIFIPRRGK